MLDEKQIWAFFLFEFKTDCKAMETTCNIYNTFGPGTTKEHTVQWWFKKSAKETRALKMRSAEASPQKLTTTNWEQSSKLVLLQLHEKFLKNSVSTILWSFSIWSKVERWKSSISGCLMSWPKIKKIVILKCLLLFYATTTNHFLVGLWCMTKSGFCTIGNDQLSSWRNSKALPKAELAPKVMVTVWWSAACLIH